MDFIYVWKQNENQDSSKNWNWRLFIQVKNHPALVIKPLKPYFTGVKCLQFLGGIVHPYKVPYNYTLH